MPQADTQQPDVVIQALSRRAAAVDEIGQRGQSIPSTALPHASPESIIVVIAVRPERDARRTVPSRARSLRLADDYGLSGASVALAVIGFALITIGAAVGGLERNLWVALALSMTGAILLALSGKVVNAVEIPPSAMCMPSRTMHTGDWR